MKILIIKGRDVHTYGRIVPGFSNYNNQVEIIEKYEDLTGSHYDLTLIDPSVKFDPSSKLNSEHTMFYDCEDSALDFYPDIAYYSLKDKIKYYAKMNYVEGDRNDGVKNIAFPLPVYNQLSQIAKHDFMEFKDEYSKSFLLGHGTFIGNYSLIKGHYNCFEDISSIGIYNNNGKTELLYNQRIDWILSMIKNNIPYFGGIVFGSDNLSEDWQSKYFGNVKKIKAEGMSWLDTFKQHAINKIGLCPTGHERISWRTFDLMSSGSIIFWTDNKKQQSLIMPQEYITVPDGIDFGKIYFENEKNFKEIWKASQKNKQSIADLTPEKVMEKFFNQLC